MDIHGAKLFIPGQNIIKKGVFIYQCPVCKKKERFDDEYGPACTGPHPSLHEHEPTPMILIVRP